MTVCLKNGKLLKLLQRKTELKHAQHLNESGVSEIDMLVQNEQCNSCLHTTMLHTGLDQTPEYFALELAKVSVQSQFAG